MNPNYVEIRQHYALNSIKFGREEEGLAEFQRLIDVDPLSLRLKASLGRELLLMRQYYRAIDQLHQTLETDQNSVAAHEWLGDAYGQKECIRKQSRNGAKP